MKSIFKEILLCIWSLIREIITEGIYAIKQILILLVIMCVPFLLAFGIGTSFDFPIWLTITIGIIILILFICLYAIMKGNFEKPFCKVPIVAKIVDTMTLRYVNDDAPYNEVKYYILVLEYKHKNKIYKKKIEVNELKLKEIGDEVNIMICDKFPKIIYLVKEETKNNIDKKTEKMGFSEWYMYNKLPEDLKEKIIKSFKKNSRGQVKITIFSLLISFIGVAAFHIEIGKNYDFGTIFVFYLCIWLLTFIFILSITFGINSLVKKNTPYSVYLRLIRKKAICELESEEAEQKFLQELRKKI